MDFSASEFTAYGGLRIKEELIIKEESIEEAYSEQVTVGGAYEIEQVFLKIDPGMMTHDKFCWRCCGPDTTLKCLGCVRSFHTNCGSRDDTNGANVENWLCYVCANLKLTENVDKKSDLDMLPILIEKALKDKSFNTLKHPLEGATDELIVNPMDLTKIQKNIATYTSFDHFLADVQWIVHNCFILILENHEKMEIAKSLVDYLEEEIEIIKKCAECYANSEKHPNSWFTMTCSVPHLIVWAKKMGFNYWPAKMMLIDGQLINVRFFGDYKYSDVPATNCFLYSDTNPNKSRNTSVSYKSALKEADAYMKNTRDKYGSYNLVEAKTAFNPSSLSKYIVQVIPQLAGSQLVKTLKAKLKMPEQSNRKPVTSATPKPKKPSIEENEIVTRNVVPPISPRKNVVIALARIDQDDDRMLNSKRNSSKLDCKNSPREKKIKLTHPNATVIGVSPEIKHDTPVTIISDESSNNVIPNDSINDTMDETKTEDTDQTVLVNGVMSSVQAEEINGQVKKKGMNGEKEEKETNGLEEKNEIDGHVKEMLNSTEIECSVEDSMEHKKQNSIADLSFIGGISIEEPTSTVTLDDLEWEHTVKALSVSVHSLVDETMKSKFKMLKNKVQAVTIERDQLALKAERAQHKIKEEHAKEIAELNEAIAQAIAKAKDAENFWTAEFEKQKAKINDLNEANRLMDEKLADAEINLANAKIVSETERQEHKQAFARLQEQHKIEMDSEKQRMATENEVMKKIHSEKVTELETKLQDTINKNSEFESQLETKYRDIVAGIRQKAEIERKERLACACCGKALEIKRVCSTQCELMLGVWSPNVSDKTLE